MSKYAARPGLAKALFEYIFHHENDVRNVCYFTENIFSDISLLYLEQNLKDSHFNSLCNLDSQSVILIFLSTKK